MRNIPIGQYLVENNLITQQQLENILQAQREAQGQKRFGDVIVELGYMSEVRFARTCWKVKVAYVDLDRTEIDFEAVSRIPEALAKNTLLLQLIFKGRG